MAVGALSRGGCAERARYTETIVVQAFLAERLSRPAGTHATELSPSLTTPRFFPLSPAANIPTMDAVSRLCQLPMTLRIHNTLSRQLETFTPIEPNHVRMYVCGITIYDLCHVGHARMMIAFDLIYRWLRVLGHQVTYVRNVTDIDDKIIRRALERGIAIRALTDEMIVAMHTDLDALGMLRPTHEPRATEYVPQMLAMIKALEGKGLAYRSTNGDVNYAVRKFAGYGKLSGKSIDELRSGERVAVLDGKDDPLDFVLWKAAKPERARRCEVRIGYGMGRPGWHIECSAMACALLGERFDLHGGGADLQFPHHENEIAQSEGATGKARPRSGHTTAC